MAATSNAESQNELERDSESWDDCVHDAAGRDPIFERHGGKLVPLSDDKAIPKLLAGAYVMIFSDGEWNLAALSFDKDRWVALVPKR